MGIHKTRFWLIVLALLVAAISQTASLSQQNENARYFPETGHWVTGVFLQKYNEIENAELLYGFPITDAFAPKVPVGSPQILIQYFERIRFEYQPDDPTGLGITLSNIGIYLYDNRTPGEIVTTQPGLAACQYFSQNDYQVCYAFLDFFKVNGGIQQFGYPLSEVEIQDGRMVQYFQRARFEWQPEQPSGKRVVLTDIGQLYFEMVEDPTKNWRSDFIPDVLIDLKVRAFVETAVIGIAEQQTLYVAVYDQNERPVSNAQVTFTLNLPGGATNYLMPSTNGKGITSITFPADGEPGSMVPVTVTVNYEELQKQAVTSYRIWW